MTDMKPLFIYDPDTKCIVQIDQPSLRDRFAMAALTGIMAKHESWFSPQERAELAYELADAMMKEREAKS